MRARCGAELGRGQRSRDTDALREDQRGREDPLRLSVWMGSWIPAQRVEGALCMDLASPQVRSSGGKEAWPHSRPYVAYLEIQRRDERIRCGGFLVAENFVLTAARCQGESITVVLGAHNVSQWEPSQQVIPVQRQIPHPQYNSKTLNNDIMILQGDSGASLVCGKEAQGIVSWGSKDGTPPAVYTRVSPFRPWIPETIDKVEL
nr:granzyme H-like [Pelodiscus sinensis]|eukprot:XP_014427353.1 granzyme H-like [Pelodiscus sinensis]